ncbi:sarcoplasmic calcium-binding [Paramuricea clavata]|uniref:Sarcoplasmic calcium-binding n=1 Tax=Paramuricea clavata TaxID=317549 RepID=A0A7D9E3A5_PARCT|nr:sarcoplasmic calcium-binding [Paramuricea clavata]
MSNLTEKQRGFHLQKMRTRYYRLDLNNDGFISREDFEIIATKLQEYSKLDKEKSEQIRNAFRFVAETAGLKPGVKIPIEEAAKIANKEYLSMTPEQQQATVKMLGPVFEALDFNNDGHISREEFKWYFQTLAPDLSDADVTHSFNVIDSNKNGEISREEFFAAAFDFYYGVEETEISKVFFGPLMS